MGVRAVSLTVTTMKRTIVLAFLLVGSDVRAGGDLTISGVEFADGGSRILLEYANASSFAGRVTARIQYPGVTRPFGPERDYCENADGTIVGFNLKPVVGVNDICLIATDASGIRIVPHVNSVLHNLLKARSIKVVPEALYLERVDGDLLRVKFEPYGYRSDRPARFFTFKFRLNAGIEFLQEGTR